MLEASIAGHAQPRNRTLDVDANLLAEWLERRNTVRESAMRLTALVVAMSIVMLVTIPLLWSASARSRQRAEIATGKLASAMTAERQLELKLAAAKPMVDESAMRITARREARQMLGHLLLVQNAARPGMAFESISAEVLGGELTIRCRADAESIEAAQSFAEEAATGPKVRSTLIANSQRNGKLGNSGIGFELVRRAEVTP